MTTDPLIDKLAIAINMEDSQTCGTILSRLVDQGVTADIARHLLLLMDDSSDDIHAMYGIIHAVEKLPPDTVYRIITELLPQLIGIAPYWSETIVMRLLSAKPEQGHGYDALAFLCCVESTHNAETINFIKCVYKKLEDKPNAHFRKLIHPILR
jgi:hypothetical protein